MSVVRFKGTMTNDRYYLLGHLDVNQKFDSLVTKTDAVMNIYEQICEYFLEITGTSTWSLVVELASLSRHHQNDKLCSYGITTLRNSKQKFIQREMVFQEILYVTVYLIIFREYG